MRLRVVPSTAAAAAVTTAIVARRVVGSATAAFHPHIVAAMTHMIGGIVPAPGLTVVADVIAATALPDMVGGIVRATPGGDRIRHGERRCRGGGKQRDSSQVHHDLPFLKSAVDDRLEGQREGLGLIPSQRIYFCAAAQRVPIARNSSAELSGAEPPSRS